MKGKYLVILLIAALLAITVGCGPGTPPEPTATPVPTPHPGEAVIKSKCVTCHDLGRVTSFTSDLDGWTFTVDHMIQLGASLSDVQREQSIDYLTLTYPSK